MGRMLTRCMGRRGLMRLAASMSATVVLAGCSSGAPDADATSSAPSETSIPATEENVRLIGRTFAEDGVTWLPQSGSAVEFEVTGTRVTVELVGDESVDGEPGQRPRFAILVDGEVVMDDTLDRPSRVVEVPLDEPLDGSAVEVMHLSEASRGMVGIRSVAVEPGTEAPVRPTDAKDLHIAFAGDSITCAYGVEAASIDEPFKTTTENFMKSYAYLAAQELGADYDTVCYSGYGIVSGWSADGMRNTSSLLPPLYGLVAEGHEQAWDFSAHPSDVVVINLGTNDLTYTGIDEARVEEFVQGYVEFLGQVRELNPESLIVCTLGTMGESRVLYPAIERAVGEHAARTGDERVRCYLSDPIDMAADGCGTNGHPNEATQRKSAEQLVDVIRQELGANA